jgi:hypothetical protein
VSLLYSNAAVAQRWSGKFCVVSTDLPPNCRFMDEDSCARAAIAQDGACVTNPHDPIEAAQPVEPRNASYCLIRAGLRQCYFYDAESCAKVAKERGGTCITRPKMSRPQQSQ